MHAGAAASIAWDSPRAEGARVPDKRAEARDVRIDGDLPAKSRQDLHRGVEIIGEILIHLWRNGTIFQYRPRKMLKSKYPGA